MDEEGGILQRATTAVEVDVAVAWQRVREGGKDSGRRKYRRESGGEER